MEKEKVDKIIWIVNWIRIVNLVFQDFVSINREFDNLSFIIDVLLIGK